jgi:triosephosphate isomerase
MHFLAADARGWCTQLRRGLATSPADVEAVVFPSHPLLAVVSAALEGSPLELGGQDLHPAGEGAHTGEVSGRQLVDAGCRWVLCGHSERRRDHGEDDEVVARKVAAAARAGLAPVLCLGETGDERKAGRTEEVLDRQLSAGAAAAPEGLVVAYEPVWAIGTGETATPELAQQAHAFLRRRLETLLSKPVAGTTRILYGGSVKPENAGALAAEEDIDGFLVGGASLDPEKFLAIMVSCGRAGARPI